MPTVHLVCGPTGAGKTTFARPFAARVGALCFVIDEWMAALFWPDAPKEPNFSWALARVRRCEEQIWRLAAQALALGQDVVLECGYFQRDQRDDARERARTLGAHVRVHHVTADVAVRRERVRRRNGERSGTHQVKVDDETFEWAEGYFQAPAPEERAEVVDGSRARPG